MIRHRIEGRSVARQFCPTYPSRFIVPNGLEDFFLEAVAQFRHRRRIPALAYYHAPTKVEHKGCG